MSFDLTGLGVDVISIVFPIVSAFIARMISSQMKDQQAAAVLSEAVANSLGAMQQAATGLLVYNKPHIINMPSVSPTIQTGVQYVIEHAGPEAERLGISPEAIATKVTAKLGLAAIATNLAIAGSPSVAQPSPLAPLLPMQPGYVPMPSARPAVGGTG